MKKKFVFLTLVLVTLLLGLAAWIFFRPLSGTGTQPSFLYIRSQSTMEEVEKQIQETHLATSTLWFRMAARLIGYHDVKPGRYKISGSTNLVDLVRMLKNGRQTPVQLVITKIRTRDMFAERVGNQFECGPDGLRNYLNNADSLRAQGFDSNTIMAAVLPLTYEVNWSTQPGKIFARFFAAYRNFWNDERKKKASELGYSPLQIATLASIIDEETNSPSDRPNIASVYLNRLAKGIPLQADPTVKFALGNFELRRIYEGQLKVNSPYNTYQNKGLPPGPICTPSLETIEAVLNAPKTDYLFFVANSDFSGTHVFTVDYQEHLKFARLYTEALNKRNIK